MPRCLPPSAEIRILYDGECPLCRREISLLERIDGGRGRLDFEDISKDDFDASVYGLETRSVHERIHGILPDGTAIEGVEVFRRAYAAIGLGWLVAPTRWPGLRRITDALYRWFARNRLRMTGRRLECDGDRCHAVPLHDSGRPSSEAGADAVRPVPDAS